MAGLIVVPNTGLIRHVQFIADLFALDKPPGTQVSFPQSGSVVQNLNRALLELSDSHEWVWLQADDHAFPTDLLSRLMAHEKDIVCPLIVKRNRPDTLVFGNEIEIHDEKVGRTYPAYETIPHEDIPKELFTVEIAGTAGMLVRRNVLETIGYPYFESTDGLYLNEDIEFSRKVRRHGFDIWIDPQARMAHLITMPVWPL